MFLELQSERLDAGGSNLSRFSCIVYIYIYVYVYIYIYIYINLSLSLSIYIYICNDVIHIYIYIYMYIYIYIYICNRDIRIYIHCFSVGAMSSGTSRSAVAAWD